MQEFDTLKISIPADAIRRSNSEIWRINTSTDGETGEQVQTYVAKQKALPVGISNLSSAKGGIDYQLTFSAKVLGQDYLNGITLNNWDRVLDELNSVIDIDKNKVFENSRVFSCDTTNNLSIDEIGYSHRNIYDALLCSRANIRFVVPPPYRSEKKQGIEFRGVQTEKNRCIFYSKHLDLQKPTNREFMRSVPDPMKLITQSEKQVRCEVNHTALRSIRNRLKIADNSFKSVLNSTAPVNHNFLKKVMNVSDIKQTSLFGEWSNFKSMGGDGKDFIFIKGIQSIIESLDYCDVAVKVMFQDILGDGETFKYHWYKKRNSIKSILEGMKSKEYGIDTDTSNLIANKVLELLFKAVA